MKPVIGIIGVGYVGIQNALAISAAGFQVIAYDTNALRIKELNEGIDNNHEVQDVARANLVFTHDLQELKKANYFLISVPTPINAHMVPDIFPLKSASRMVAEVLKKGDVVILESTVFPGATRNLLIPIIEEHTGLKSDTDFYVGYSSERIVPGDTSHNLSNMTKVISGQSEQALDKIKKLYKKVFTYNLHIAPSMEVAESSKLLENIQRDVNIALMNEFSQIVDKMGLSIHDVLDAAKTKWNFLPFTPGLVGGHCIPEDPYYLIYQANKLGVPSNLISCARQTNEQFIHFIVDSLVKLLSQSGFALKDAKVAVLGISFKPNVSDIRHSLSIVMCHLLQQMGMEVLACDPVAHRQGTDLHWADLADLTNCQAVLICQAHDEFVHLSASELGKKLVPGGVIVDIPGIYTKKPDFRKDIVYWSL